MRKISDEEALKNFENSIVGIDLKKIKLVKLSLKDPKEKSLKQVLEAMKREVKGKKEKNKTVDVFGREELEKQKNWIRYKIEKGWIE